MNASAQLSRIATRRSLRKNHNLIRIKFGNRNQVDATTPIPEKVGATDIENSEKNHPQQDLNKESTGEPQGAAFFLFDKDVVLPRFHKAINTVVDAGKSLKEREDERNKKTQREAIHALGGILGIFHEYFLPIADDEKATKVLMSVLYEQCNRKQKSSRTSVFHLFSMILRGDDRKQASADAKILKRAYSEGVTEQTFSDWVQSHGSLTNIVKGVDVAMNNAKQAKENRRQAEIKRKGYQKYLFEIANKASWQPMGNFHHSELPKYMRELFPSDGKWRPIAIERVGDEIRFYVTKPDHMYNELTGHVIENVDTATVKENSSAVTNIEDKTYESSAS